MVHIIWLISPTWETYIPFLATGSSLGKARAVAQILGVNQWLGAHSRLSALPIKAYIKVVQRISKSSFISALRKWTSLADVLLISTSKIGESGTFSWGIAQLIYKGALKITWGVKDIGQWGHQPIPVPFDSSVKVHGVHPWLTRKVKPTEKITL